MRNIQDVSYGLFLTDRQLDFLFNYPQGFNRMRCFATFLRMAVKVPTRYVKKEYSVDLTPGQFAVSEVELARLWKCNRKTASKVVDLFHEVGLVSSVPNCRTTVFTVHCIASWYVADQVIRNEHYSRHHQVEQRVKAKHKAPMPVTCDGKSVHHEDDRTDELRDGYTPRCIEPVTHSNSGKGNACGEVPSKVDALPPIMDGTTSTLPFATSDGRNTAKAESQPPSRHPSNHLGDVTTLAGARTSPDDAG